MRDLFQRLDPRARLLAILVFIVVIGSTPRGVLRPFPAYAGLIALLLLTGRASGFYLTWRCLAASPFILLAAGLLALQAGPEAALTVALKGYSAALLLAFLTFTTPLADLLWALRHLHAPPALNLILGMMYRYTNLLSEEYARMERARECRTVRPLGRRRFAIYGHQLGALVLRSWDRADRVHSAMLSRGFTGVWPTRSHWTFGAREAAFLASFAAALLILRLALAPQ